MKEFLGRVVAPVSRVRRGPVSLPGVSLRSSGDALGSDNALARENVRVSCIYTNFECTSEIQRLIISRAIAGVHIR